jgi:Protein of unknown function (DUF2950)
MGRGELNFQKCVVQFRMLMTVELLLATAIFANTGVAQERKGEKTFATPDEASEALYAAAKSHDERMLLEIFGTGGKQILHSGDDAEDTDSRATFLKEYEEMHRLVQEPDGSVVLYIGAKNWPVPIPLVNHGNLWRFDTEAGLQEILFRRIGRNETSAIQVCRALAAAEKEFAQERHEYAQKIFSDEGRKNGLYWEVADGQPESPIGPLVAQAVTEGYARNPRGKPTPYRGYFFHILKAQGKNAPGGAKSYLAGDKMNGGFAFVAYPAEYRSSGVKTFLVSADGVVFEKDLGANTETIASSMTRFNPDSTWHRTDDDQN